MASGVLIADELYQKASAITHNITSANFQQKQWVTRS